MQTSKTRYKREPYAVHWVRRALKGENPFEFDEEDLATNEEAVQVEGRVRKIAELPNAQAVLPSKPKSEEPKREQQAKRVTTADLKMPWRAKEKNNAGEELVEVRQANRSELVKPDKPPTPKQTAPVAAAPPLKPAAPNPVGPKPMVDGFSPEQLVLISKKAEAARKLVSARTKAEAGGAAAPVKDVAATPAPGSWMSQPLGRKWEAFVPSHPLSGVGPDEAQLAMDVYDEVCTFNATNKLIN